MLIDGDGVVPAPRGLTAPCLRLPQDDTDSMYSLLGLRRPGSCPDMDLSLSLSDVALSAVKQEPHALSDAELNAIAKDRQKKDNHNMSTCWRRRRGSGSGCEHPLVRKGVLRNANHRVAGTAASSPNDMANFSYLRSGSRAFTPYRP